MAKSAVGQGRSCDHGCVSTDLIASRTISINRTTEKLIGTFMIAFVSKGFGRTNMSSLLRSVLQGHLLYLTVAHKDPGTCAVQISLVFEYTVNTAFRSDRIYETSCHLRVLRLSQRCIEDVTLRPFVERFQTFQRNRVAFIL
jgi:hypothetical protein